MKSRALIPVLLLLAACSSTHTSTGASTSTQGSGSVPLSTAPATTDTGTTVVTTTVPTTDSSTGTTTDTTTGTTTTGVATTLSPTTTPCTSAGDRSPKGTGDPLTLSSLIGKDIRAGGHPCFERVVIELQGTGDFPGWAAEWVDDPVRLGESDEFVTIDGNATLLVRMGMWMRTMEGDGYTGSLDIHPTNVAHIKEMRNTEDFEGMSIWAIGVDAEYPFTVQVFHSPERLVIDIQTGP